VDPATSLAAVLQSEDAHRAEVLALRPELAVEVRRLHDAIWSASVSPVTLELCRLRMATLLRSEAALAERTPAARAAGLDEARIATLASWPTAPGFSDEERACLAFAELWVIDPHAITDDDAAAVLDALGPAGMITFTTALGVWDGQHRFDNALGITRAGEA
jgi:alkylhydroperoxidase family enzyme